MNSCVSTTFCMRFEVFYLSSSWTAVQTSGDTVDRRDKVGGMPWLEGDYNDYN